MAIYGENGVVQLGSQPPPAQDFTPVAERPNRPQQGPFTQVAAKLAEAQPTATPSSFLGQAVEGAAGSLKGLITGVQKSILPPAALPKDFYEPTTHPTAEHVGEFLGTAGTAVGSYGLGKAALTRVLGATSPRVAAYLAQTGAETIPLAQPTLLRIGGSMGGSLGFGAEQATRGAIEGEPLPEIAKRAGAATALSLGGDAVAYGLARAIGVHPRDFAALTGQATPEQVAALGAVDREVAAAQLSVAKNVQVIHQQLKTGQYVDPGIVGDIAKAEAATQQAVQDRAWMSHGYQAGSVDTARKVVAAESEKALAAESAKLGQRIQQLSTQEMVAQLQANYGVKSATKALPKIQKRLAEARILGAQKTQAQELMGQVARGEAAAVPAAHFYLTDTHKNGKWLYGMVRLNSQQDAEASRFMARLFKSPDSVARSQGLSMGVLGNEAIEASNATRLRFNRFKSDMDELWGKLASARGIGVVRSHIPSAKWAKDILDVHESPAGLAGVRAQFPKPVADAWEGIIQRAEAEMTDAEKVAGAIRMSPAEKLRLLNGGDYFPQVPIPKQYLLRQDPRALALVRLRSKQGRPIHLDEAQEIIARLDSNRRAGLKKVGNLDFERSIPGTTSDKVAAGWKMIDDPRQALEVYGQGLAHRIEYAKRFGNRLELVDAIKESARREGANMAEVHTAADLLTGATYFDSAFKDTVRRLTNIQVLEKMGLSAIPNLSQQVNTVLFAGLKNFTRGLVEFKSSSSRARVMEGLAAQEGIMSSLEHAIAGEERQGMLGLATKGLLNLNAFSPVENLNREVGMMVSQAVAKDLIAKGLAGRLRGVTLSHAQNQAAALGFDLSKVLQKGGQLTDAEFNGLLEGAIARGARETQFVPDVTRLPYYWQHPYGKLFAQFKSFSFSQAKFIRDSVFREALEGNLKPLAYYLTLYPMAGEMVNSTLDAIRNRPRRDAFDPTAPFTDLERYVTTMASAGAMGIAWNIYTGAKYDNLFTALVGGPTVGDINDVAKAAFGPHPWRDLAKKAERSPSYRFGQLAFKMMAVPVEALVEAAKAASGDDSAPASKSLDELLMESAQAKRATQ